MNKENKYTIDLPRSPLGKERAAIANLLMDMADKGAEVDEFRRVSAYSSELVATMEMYQKLKQCREDNGIGTLMEKYKIR